MFVRDVAWGDSRPLRHALDAAWKTCEGKPIGEAELQEMLAQCEQCAPESELFESLYTSPAQDATFAICALLEFMMRPDIDRIVSIPRFSSDTVDLIVQEQENMDPLDLMREHKILRHPLMQQELIRQQRDLSTVYDLDARDTVALSVIRERARGESVLRKS